MTEAEVDGFAVVVTGAAAIQTTPFSGLDPLVHAFRNHVAELPSAERAVIEHAFEWSAAVDPEADPVVMGRGVLRLLLAVASDAPVVLAVDDLHLLDRSSASAIAEIGRLAEREGVVVVTTTRPGSSHQSPGAHQSIIELHALDDADAQLVMERHGRHLDDVQREQVLRNAAGNPLALIELLGAFASTTEVVTTIVSQMVPVTPLLRRSFGEGLHDLSPAARDAVLIAAVEDETAVHELVAATSALVGRIGIEDLDEVVSAGMLYGDDLRLQFRHELTRSVVLHEETLARRQRAHKAIAEVVGDGPRRVRHEAQSVPMANEQLGDELEQMYPLYVGARNDDRGRGPRTGGSAHDRLGQANAAVAAGGRSRERVRSRRCRRSVPDGGFPTSDVCGSTGVCRRAPRPVRRGPSPHRTRALCDLADLAVGKGDHQLALDLLLAAAERAWWLGADRDTRAAIDERASAIPGAVRRATPGRDTCAHQSDRQWRSGVRLPRERRHGAGSGHRGAARLRDRAHAIGDPHRVSELCSEAEARCRADGLLGVLPQVLSVQAHARLEIGDWDRAVALAGEAAEIAERTEQWNWVAAAKVVLAHAYALQGNGERALVLAGESQHLAETRGLHDVRALVRVARGATWLSAGCYHEAYDELMPLFDDRAMRDTDRERMSAIMLLAEAAVHSGRDDDARRIVADVEATGGSSPSPLLRMQLTYADAVLASDGDAEERYRDALARDLVGWPWVRGGLSSRYGSWLRRQRRVVESRSRLRAACDTLELLGATTWAEHAVRTELRVAGERKEGRRNADGTAIRGCLVAAGTRDRPTRCRRPLEPRDRPSSVPFPPHRRFAPLPHLPQVGHHVSPVPLRVLNATSAEAVAAA